MGLTETESEELKEAFDLFDRDGDGSIGLDELANVLALLGQDAYREELTAFLSGVDRDNSGMIERDEFVALMTRHLYTSETTPNPEAEMAAAFRVLDKDNDGLIGPDELRAALVAMGERVSQEDIESMIKTADRNGDGQIDFEEFVAVLKED